MKKVNFKKVTATIMAIAMMVIPMISEMKNTDSSPISSSETLVVSAAEQVRKCYTISTSNIPVFSNTQLTAKIGSIYSSDEVRVHSVTSKYCYVSYPISGGKYKYGYISTSSILLSTGKNTVTSKGKISTYKRPSTSSGSYGAIYKGDSVKILGETAGMVQIKYPINGGYKYAFVTKSDAQTYLNYPNGNSASNVSTKPAVPTVYQQTGNSWSSYKYGWYYKNGKKVDATIGSSGCGIVSLTNAIKYLNGTFIDPTIIAKYSLNNGYRINNVGTAYGLYKSWCNSQGKNYGVKFIANISDYKSLQNYLSAGNIAIIHIPGHIMACVDYKNGKYLVLDSSSSKSRGTSSGYAWKTEKEMINMKVVSDFYIIGRR